MLVARSMPNLWNIDSYEIVENYRIAMANIDFY